MPTYRDQKLLALARKCPCMAQFAHGCTMYLEVDPPALYAVEAAHSDSSKYGRGMRKKTSDWAIAAMCHNAHVALDSRELAGCKEIEWQKAHKLTLDYLFEKKLIGVL